MSSTIGALSRGDLVKSLENEQPTLGERAGTMELIEKSERINSLVKEQVMKRGMMFFVFNEMRGQRLSLCVKIRMGILKIARLNHSLHICRLI